MEIISLIIEILKYTFIILIVSVTATILAKKIKATGNKNKTRPEALNVKDQQRHDKQTSLNNEKPETKRRSGEKPSNGEKGTSDYGREKSSNGPYIKVIDKKQQVDAGQKPYHKHKKNNTPRISVLNEELKKKEKQNKK